VSAELPARVNPIGRALSDAGVLAWRSLKRIPRTPDMLIYATIQPIMFVLLFAYVFGNAIPIPGFPGPRAYREFLMSGIFAQTMAFAVASASVGLADDMSKGLIDRFRSLPMARSGVIAGRVVGDLVFNAFVMLIMVLCGFVVGWRWHNGLGQALAAFAILLLFAFAMLWVGALIGLSVGGPEVASSAGLIWLFPLTFLSNAFVPTPQLQAPVRQPVPVRQPGRLPGPASGLAVPDLVRGDHRRLRPAGSPQVPECHWALT
jgi:ABC-type transport system involved in multi-copper enzyme maturation permease subunit